MDTKAARKAMKREYLEAKRPMGVFRVLNTTNGKALVGTSIDLPAMLNRQKAQLQLRAHPNRALQNDWNELGPDAFTFEALDTLTPPDRPDYNPADDLRELERLWLEKLGNGNYE